MAPDAAKFNDASAAPKDAVSEVGNFDGAALLGGEAFKIPESPAEQADALNAVNPMGAEQTGFKAMDEGMGAATELIPDFGNEVAGAGNLTFDNSIYEGEGSDKDADANQKDNMEGNASHKLGQTGMILADLGKGNKDVAEMVDKGLDNFLQDDTKGLAASITENPHKVVDENTAQIQKGMTV